MTDREKVIREIQYCTNGCADPGEDECNPGKCRYAVYQNSSDYDCKEMLLKDALALLKDQEPRVLTLDQVCGGDECWIEYKYGGYGYADVYFSSEPDGTALVYRCSPVRDRKPETVWFHDYGKLWRGWSYRPSLEQMRDTPWEDSNNE